MRKRWYLLISFMVCFIMGTGMVIPIFNDKRSAIDILNSFFDKPSFTSVGDETPNPPDDPIDPEPFYGSFNFPEGYNPQKYYNDSGTWKPINLTIKEYNQGGYKYIVDETWYNFYMKSNSNWGDGFKFEKDDYYIIYQPSDYSYRNEYGSQDYLANIQDKVGIVDNTDYTITYNDVFTDVDFQYKMEFDKVKEYFIINELPRTPNTWLTGTITLDFGGYIKYGSARVYADGVDKTGQSFVTSNRIEFRDSSGADVIFFLPDPYAYDSNNSSISCQYEVKDQGGQIWFYLRTPYSWIQTAVLPVYVDPIYGTIVGGVVDSEEWDTANGYVENPDAFVRLGTSNYFMTSGRGTDADGFLTVIEVSDAGVFNDDVISEWEYDITDGSYAGILHIADDIYAVYHVDAGNGVLFTTHAWSSNGTLQKTMIDSETYTKPRGSHLIHVTGDIYALSYQEEDGGYDHFLETYEITSAGAISARIDVVEYDESSTSRVISYAPHMALVDSNTVAIVMSNNVKDGSLYTYNISDAGDITNTRADYWEFDGTYCAYQHIKKISGNVFAIAYTDIDSDGQIKTLAIANTGSITKSWIDELEFDTAYCYYPTMFTVADASSYNPGVYGITYRGIDADGFVVTMNITSAGDIGTVIDSLEFDIDYNYFYAPTIRVAGDIYVICYTGTGTDGWAVTVNITTPPEFEPWVNTCPTSSNPTIANHSTDVSINVGFWNITISDANGNTTSGTINCSGIANMSWTTQANGTRSLTLPALSYSTNYTVWLNYTDGHCDKNETFWFVTEDENIPPDITNVYPDNDYAGITELTPICTVTIEDDDGDLMTVIWEEFQTPIWVEVQRNTSVANGTYRWHFVNATEYSTGYTFRITVQDDEDFDEAQRYFTTISSRSWQTVDSGWFNFNTEERSWQTISSGWFTFDTSDRSWQTIQSGWFTFNTGDRSWNTIESGWFSFDTTDRDWSTIDSGWFTFDTVDRTWNIINPIGDWNYKKQITLDNTQVPANLVNFPVLINITDTDLRDKAQSDGDDIFFVNSIGVKLNHEIELYVNTTGRLVAWVNVTSLSSSADTVIYMYYGNPSCSSQQNVEDTWDSNYVAVYHMNDSTTSTIKDSTSNNNDGTKKGANEPVETSGKIGKGQHGDGADDYVNCGSADSVSSYPNGITISTWLKRDVIGVIHGVVTKGATASTALYRDFDLVISSTTNNPFFYVSNGAAYILQMSSAEWTLPSIDTNYHMITVAWDGTTNANAAKLYGDGVLSHSKTATGLSSTMADNWNVNLMGYWYEFDGSLDEVRISNIARSADWIKAEYNNQVNATDGGFFTLGNEETALYSGWFTFNTSDRVFQTIDLGWFDFNTSIRSYQTVESGWFNFDTVDKNYATVESGWFTFSTTDRSWNTIDSGYFIFNTADRSFQTVQSGWFNFDTVAKQFQNIEQGWFNFNIESRTYNDIESGWFTFDTADRSWNTIDSGWFSFDTTDRGWSAVDSGYFTFDTVDKTFTTIDSGWFTFDTTDRTYQTISSGWFTFDTTTITYHTVQQGWFTFQTTGTPIQITNIYPTNNSHSIPIQPYIYFTINSTTGKTMNATIYYSTNQTNINTLLTTYNNITNTTLNQLYLTATGRFTGYYWRIQANDGTNHINQTYNFKTEGHNAPSGYIPNSNTLYIAVLSIFGIIAFILIIIKKKRDE